jgi:hypothetical protein
MANRTSRAAILLTALATGFVAAPAALATAVGTVGTPGPGPITVTVGGTTTFTATNFQFLISNSAGGVPAYTAEDISIDLTTGGGQGIYFTFTKNPNGPTAGSSFFVNAGQTRGFTFSYDLTITPAIPGVVDYTSLMNTMQENSAQNGLASVETILPGGPNSQIFTGNTSNTVAVSGKPNTVSVGNIVALTGNSGNAAIGHFDNLLTASYAVAPEPTTLTVVTAAGALIGRRPRRG